jgi:pyrroline-5-carboxylate reductase
METNKSLGFIGGGRITKIFLQAFQNKALSFKSVKVFDTNKDVINTLKKQFPNIQISNDIKQPAKQDIVFIALHPPVIMETLEIIKADISESSLVISLAPKISFEKLLGKLKTNNIARMIPNATSYINEGYNPISFSPDFSATEKQFVMDMLLPLGKTFEVEESKLESYAILSAMLPTYFWFQWQELQEIGLKLGLNEKESKTTIKETLLAAINIFYNSDLTQDQVIDLIPVKPIGEHENEIKEVLNGKLIPLFEKIKP